MKASKLLSWWRMATDFYVRYYVGHKGKFGHEFLEFEFRPDGEFHLKENDVFLEQFILYV